jgi:hypothetical protein
MPRFLVRPIDEHVSSAEITAPDAASILGHVQRLDCQEADIFRDGAYSFSLRLGQNGMWSIFQRGDGPQAAELDAHVRGSEQTTDQAPVPL